MDDPTFLIAECLNRLKKKYDESGIPPEHPPASQLSEEQQDLMNRANRATEALDISTVRALHGQVRSNPSRKGSLLRHGS